MKGKKNLKPLVEEDDEPYSPTDSEDEYSDSEKILLQDVRQRYLEEDEESEEEVYRFDSDNSQEDHGEGDGDDDDAKEISDSDIERMKDRYHIPDSKAWGQKKKSYYDTDYKDKDFLGYTEDLEEGEKEEDEATEIQKHLLEQLDDADYSLDLFSKKVEKKEEEELDDEIIKSDLTRLSKRQKLTLLAKESPEFASLVDEFKANMAELIEKIDPIMKLIKQGKLPDSPANNYIRTKYELILNYCINIAFYLLLKAKKINVQVHPVICRLFQYRNLLTQLEPVNEGLKPQIEKILELSSKDDFTAFIDETENQLKPQKKKKRLQILSTVNHASKKLKIDKEAVVESNKVNDQKKKQNDIEGANETSTEEDDEDEEKEKEEEKETAAKRAITYQISKNKGLTPHRKKEMRNPRVRHRNKYRKAIIHRKGQVRQPRKELEKYGGEISGIKIGVAKSIKLK